MIPISARQDGSNYLHSTTPDVCWTPMGSELVPVAYNSICFLEASDRLSSNVRNNKRLDWQLNTRCKKTQGHEPGTGRGVVVPGYLFVSFIKEAESKIYSDGWAIVRDGHIAWMNRHDEGPIEERRVKTTELIERRL